MRWAAVQRTDRYDVKDDASDAAIFAHSQEWLCHEYRGGVVTAGGSRTAPTRTKAAALRSRTAGSQDELRRGAIHKPPHSKMGSAAID